MANDDVACEVNLPSIADIRVKNSFWLCERRVGVRRRTNSEKTNFRFIDAICRCNPRLRLGRPTFTTNPVQELRNVERPAKKPKSSPLSLLHVPKSQTPPPPKSILVNVVCQFFSFLSIQLRQTFECTRMYENRAVRRHHFVSRTPKMLCGEGVDVRRKCSLLFLRIGQSRSRKAKIGQRFDHALS